MADKAADRAVGGADGDVNLAAVEADREVLGRLLVEPSCSTWTDCHRVEGSFFLVAAAFFCSPLSEV